MDDERTTGPLAELPDLSGLSLSEIDGLGDSALERCLRRIVAETDSGAETIAGFNAVIG